MNSLPKIRRFEAPDLRPAAAPAAVAVPEALTSAEDVLP